MIRDSWDDFITPTATRDGVGEHILRKGGFGVTPFGPHPHNRTRFEGWKGGPLAEGEFTIQPPDWGEFKEKRRFESRDPPTRKRGQDIVFVPEGHKLTPPVERVVKKRAHPEVVCILDDATARKDSHESAGLIKIRYGVPSKAPFRSRLRVVELTMDGVPKGTSETIERDPDTYQPVGWWGRGVTGPQATAFPLPGEWTFAGTIRTLDKLDASTLTGLFSAMKRIPPTCIERWEGYKQRTPPVRAGETHPTSVGAARLNVEKIGNLYSTAFLSPKLFNLQAKFVLHARFVPTWLLTDHVDTGCRLKCGCRRESVEHLAVCPMLQPLRSKLATLTGEPRFRTNNLTFLIGDSEIGVMERGTANLWFCMWYALTLAMIDCTEDGTAVSVDRVWKRALPPTVC